MTRAGKPHNILGFCTPAEVGDGGWRYTEDWLKNEVALGFEPVEPLVVLYHGTATRFIESMQQQGLIPGSRQRVHLSADKETVTKVGQRHGKPTIFVIAALKMHNEGPRFYGSANGVWLTDQVPVAYLELIQR